MDTSKTLQLNDLFESWEEDYDEKQFVQDGIINEELWNNAAKQILFILKEPTEYRPDLRKLFDNSPWPMLGYWDYGLQNTTHSTIPALREASEDSHMKMACRSSAVINLKKSPGGTTAETQEIRKAAHRDKEFILKEIEIIAADIVVCSGTDLFNMVKEVMPFDRFNGIGPDGECFSYDDSIWIRYCHPSARIYKDMMYYTLMVLYQNCLKEMSREK